MLGFADAGDAGIGNRLTQTVLLRADEAIGERVRTRMRLQSLLVLRVLMCGWLVMAIAASAQEPSSEPVRALSASALVSQLRAGGLVLYFRHTSTDFGQSDDSMTSFD